MNIFISILISFILVLIYHFFDKKPIFKYDRYDTVFSFLIFSYAIIFPPMDSPLIWVGILPLLYCVLDDFKTHSAYPFYPLISFGFFLILSFNGYSLFISFVLFLFFLLFAKFSKERFVGEGDAYFILPISYILGANAFNAIFISVLFAGVFLILLYFHKREKNYAFFPFLMSGSIIVMANWYISYVFWIGFIIFLCLSVIYFIHRLIKKNSN